MFCAKCGQRLADTVKYCPACGAPTENANKPVEPVAPAPAPEPAPVPEPAPAYEFTSAPETEQLNTNDFEEAVNRYDFGKPEDEGTGGFVYDQPEKVEEAEKAEDDAIHVEPTYAGQRVVYEKYRNPNGKAIASIVLGVVAIVLCWVPIVPVLVALIGLILGIVASKKKTGSSMFVAGLTLSIIGLVISALITAAWILMFMWMAGMIRMPGLQTVGYQINTAFAEAAYSLRALIG